jgi:cytochrome c-type biogenesis protein CcmH/NrfG
LISSRQKLAILLTAGLAVLLYFTPKLPSAAKEEEKNTSAFKASFEETMKKSTAEQKEVFTRLQQELVKAESDNSEQSWLVSANDFLKEAKQIQGDQKVVLYNGAINGFEKALKFNPDNLSAKTSLGVAYVESASLLGNQPMKGITLLREVIQKDSTNIEANLQLGLFSVNSHQYQKAIDRFRRVLRIDSTHIDTYVYLGNTYLSMGDKPKAIESFENYKIRVKDTLEIKEIDNYIKKLKQQQ